MKMIHTSGHLEKNASKDGFSFGALFFGLFWYWGHGMLGGKWIILIILTAWTIIAIPILWIVMAMRFNKEYYEHLIHKGYKPVTTK